MNMLLAKVPIIICLLIILVKMGDNSGTDKKEKLRRAATIHRM